MKLVTTNKKNIFILFAQSGLRDCICDEREECELSLKIWDISHFSQIFIMGFSLQLKVITFLKGKAHNFETNVEQ